MICILFPFGFYRSFQDDAFGDDFDEDMPSHKVSLNMCSQVIVSSGSIRWILWFSVRYATATARREIFGVNALRGKRQQLGSPNLQGIFIGGKLLWEGK